MQTRTTTTIATASEVFRIASLLTTLTIPAVVGFAAGCGLAMLLWKIF